MDPVLERSKVGSPLYTDTVSVYYRGELINNDVFDQTYTSEEFDLDFATTRNFVAGGVIDGFGAALQRMEIGDHWVVYVPYELGYGVNGFTDNGVLVIPGYSVLIYNLVLDDFWSPRPK